jgi:hypothetical protein
LSQSSAQVFPFQDDFESYNGFQVPTGYTGHSTVYLAHGTGSPASKALSPYLTSFSTTDSIIFPLIGPVSAVTQLDFDWRIVDPFLYPSTPANLTAGDKFEILASSDGITYQSIFEINSTNYANAIAFTHATVDLSAFAFGNVYLKVKGTRVNGSGEFFIDIDNVLVDNTSGINNVDSKDFQFFPTVSSGKFSFASTTPLKGNLEVFDTSGKLVHSHEMKGELTGMIDLAGLAAGKYLIRVKNAENVKISNIIIR